MGRTLRAFMLTLITLALVSCASTAQLSNEAKAQRARMTARQANLLIARYAKPSATSGGLCMVGNQTNITGLDYDVPVTTSGSVLDFAGYYARLTGSSISGNVLGGTGRLTDYYQKVRKNYAIDLRSLREVRILKTDLSGICRGYKGTYVVVMKPKGGLPDNADISFNASNQADLDTILATLTFLSPNARVVGGLGL